MQRIPAWVFILMVYAVQSAPVRPLPLIKNGWAETDMLYNVGSPYFTETFRYSDIMLQRGRKMNHVQARVNLYKKEVEIIANGVEAVLPKSMVKEVFFTDTIAGKIIPNRLRTGFPSIDGKTADHFYVVLADGKCSVLKMIEKKGTERRNAASNEIFTDYEDFESYYLFNKGEIKRLRRDRDFLLEVLSDKQTELAAYIDNNKLHLSNLDHIIQLVEYYNSL